MKQGPGHHLHSFNLYFFFLEPIVNPILLSPTIQGKSYQKRIKQGVPVVLIEMSAFRHSELHCTCPLLGVKRT